MSRRAPELVPGFSGGLWHSEQILLAPVGDRILIFGAGPSRYAVWVSDGTSEGTQLLGDGFRSIPGGVVSTPTHTYLSLDSDEYGEEVWVVEQNAERAAMSLLEDLVPGPRGSAPLEKGPGVSTTGVVYFTTMNPAGTGALRVIEAGQSLRQIADVTAGTGGFEALSDIMLFCGFDESTGWELWHSDGTAAGTRTVKDINPGGGGSGPREMHAWDGRVLFQADDGVHGRELWVTDGTELGTHLLADIAPGPASGAPYKFTSVGDRVFFNAAHPDYGLELWVTDGTTEGTRLVKDINPGAEKSEPYELCALGEQVVFSAFHPDSGEELWISDGSDIGTRLLKDIWPGPANSSPYFIKRLGDSVVFAATEPEHGRELWRSDGTPEGTALLHDVYSERIINPSSSPRTMTNVGESMFFVVNDGIHGSELWVTAGDEASTRMVMDIVPGFAGSDPRELTCFDGYLWFVALSPDLRNEFLYRSNGKLEGTRAIQYSGLPAGFPRFRELTATSHTLFFVADSEALGGELWSLRAWDPGVLKDIRPGTESSNPHSLHVWRDSLYFVADDGIHGDELWQSDGTPEGTRMVKDIAPPFAPGADVSHLTDTNAVLYFAADDDNHGHELWATDGTRAGTRLVKDVRQALLAPR